MYAKLIDGNLRIAPKMLVIGSTKVWNATAEQYAAQVGSRLSTPMPRSRTATTPSPGGQKKMVTSCRSGC